MLARVVTLVLSLSLEWVVTARLETVLGAGNPRVDVSASAPILQLLSQLMERQEQTPCLLNRH